MKGQFQERPKKPKKVPAAPEDGVDAKKKKKAKDQPKTNQNVNPAQQFRPNPMAALPPQAFPQSNASWFCFWNIKFMDVINKAVIS